MFALAAAIVLVLPTQASAISPETTIAGAGSKWISGSLSQQSGTNCSIIGGSYVETMVSAIAGYGGAPGGQVVKVGDRYYASVMISVPGNPCGSGSTLVATDLILPRGTSVDTSAPIRCFGIPRNQNDWVELTGGSWTFPGTNSSGPYCPASVGGSLTGSGGIGVGYRLLASGQLYQLFVPITSNQQLIGAGANPADQISWVLSATGTYGNGATSVWTNVFAAGGGGSPYLFFARDPSVVPFWMMNPPAGEPNNRAEWFANLYSAGISGTLCWDLHDGPIANDPAPINCSAIGSKWKGTVTSASDMWQVNGDGPNGGFVPFGYSIPGFTYTIRWKFTPSVGPVITKDITFTTLSGTDEDGDGVANNGADACPLVKGTLPNGCQPAVQSDPDGDGVFGDADKCPGQNGTGTLTGCPADGAFPGAPPPIGGTLGKIKGNKLKRSALVKGVLISVGCALDSRASATLSVTAAVAKKLKLPVKKKEKTVAIGSAVANCTAGKKSVLKLKLKRPVAKKLVKARGKIAAKLNVEFTRAGSPAATVTRSLKLT